jgi:6-pyruvoyltetrahydropterin/6-carboxytetrahydropterin synthase
MEIYKIFTFNSAHFLPYVPSSHPCGKMHGHTWTVEIHITGPLSQAGWVMDYGDLKNICLPIIDMLDHQLLNDVVGLRNPTSEWIAVWLWERLLSVLPLLTSIVVHESATTGAVYRGNVEEIIKIKARPLRQ